MNLYFSHLHAKKANKECGLVNALALNIYAIQIILKIYSDALFESWMINCIVFPFQLSRLLYIAVHLNPVATELNDVYSRIHYLSDLYTKNTKQDLRLRYGGNKMWFQRTEKTLHVLCIQFIIYPKWVRVVVNHPKHGLERNGLLPLCHVPSSILYLSCQPSIKSLAMNLRIKLHFSELIFY
jgi:hypothetical protein